MGDKSRIEYRIICSNISHNDLIHAYQANSLAQAKHWVEEMNGVATTPESQTRCHPWRVQVRKISDWRNDDA